MQTICDLTTFKIIYQDDHMIAIHKPAGLLVHPSPIDKHETQFATQILEDMVNQKVYPIHRLDKATSGLLLFALNPTSAQKISTQFIDQSIHKTYQAIIRGWPQEEGEIHIPLKVHQDKMVKSSQVNKPDQEATTYWQRMNRFQLNHALGKYPTQRYGLLKLTPTTGRKHQLRRHLNAISHPIIGDVAHGDRNHNHLFAALLNQHRLYLAATELTFRHPESSDTIHLNCEPEASFTLALNFLNEETIQFNNA